MNHLLRLPAWLAILAAFAFALPARAAAPYRVGDVLETFTTNDAKEGSFTYKPGDLSTLLVSYTMGNGKSVNRHLAAQPADYLARHRAAFLADIHGMPGIGRFFALPKMAKYPHRILLGDSDTLLARHPRQEDRITVFSFDAAGKITAIRHLDPEKDLGKLFPAAP